MSEFGSYYYSFYGVFELTSLQDNFYLKIQTIVRSCFEGYCQNANSGCVEEQMWFDEFNSTGKLLRKIKPKRLLIIAIFGVALVASKKCRENFIRSQLHHSGTGLLAKLTAVLRFLIAPKKKV